MLPACPIRPRASMPAGCRPGRGSGSAGCRSAGEVVGSDVGRRRRPEQGQGHSNSSPMIARARSTPAWPPAASAHRIGLPTSTPRAPSASAMAMSRPRRTPPSTHTSARPSTAVDDLGEDVDRGRDPIELPRTVVADDDAVDAVLDGEAGVLGGQDALERRAGATTTTGSSRGRPRSGWSRPAAVGALRIHLAQRPVAGRDVARSCRGRAARSRTAGPVRGSRAPAGPRSGRSPGTRPPRPVRRTTVTRS